MGKKIWGGLLIAGSIIDWLFRETIKAWVFDKVVHEMKPYEKTGYETILQYGVEYGVPILFFLIGVWLLLRKPKFADGSASFKKMAASVYPDHPNSPRIDLPTQFRTSIIDFLKELQTNGLNMLGDNGAILEVVQWLRQGGVDGEIRFWGKLKPHNRQTIAKQSVLTDIPASHWEHFRINWGGAFRMVNSGFITEFAADNHEVGTITGIIAMQGGDCYQDVHLDIQQARNLLARRPIVIPMDLASTRIPMRDAAIQVYDGLDKPESTHRGWAEGMVNPEEAISYFAELICKRVPVYGMAPPSEKVIKLPKSEFFRGGKYDCQHNTFTRTESKYVTFKDMVIEKSDIPIAIQKLLDDPDGD